MKKEILFRGKRYNGEWVYGYYTCLNNVPKIINDDGIFDVLRDTVGQYIGIKDKNEKKIFEGDKLSVEYNLLPNKSPIMKRNGKGILRYDDEIGKYFIDGRSWIVDFDAFDLELEIVGNIFDNPELLNKVEE